MRLWILGISLLCLHFIERKAHILSDVFPGGVISPFNQKNI